VSNYGVSLEQPPSEYICKSLQKKITMCVWWLATLFGPCNFWGTHPQDPTECEQ